MAERKIQDWTEQLEASPNFLNKLSMPREFLFEAKAYNMDVFAFTQSSY
jgi:hypothetical protein